MSDFKSASGYRRFYEDISGHQVLTSSTDDTTLKSARNTNYRIYVQRIIVWISTDGTDTWTFKDSTTGKEIAVASSDDSTRWDFDFGDEGAPLTTGENFVVDVSATGSAGHITWYGYQRIPPGTAVAAASS